jgi:hypothetical protein
MDGIRTITKQSAWESIVGKSIVATDKYVVFANNFHAGIQSTKGECQIGLTGGTTVDLRVFGSLDSLLQSQLNALIQIQQGHIVVRPRWRHRAGPRF